MRGLTLLLLVLLAATAQSQRGLAFIRLSTDDRIGLASNVVTSLYQDEKGFIWTGTANGLQRFDGSKFIHFNTAKEGSDPLPDAPTEQIVPAGNASLILYTPNLREFGVFHTRQLTYKKIALKNKRPIAARDEFRLYRIAGGKVLLSIMGHELLQYDAASNTFVPYKEIAIPAGWRIGLNAVFEDPVKNQLWAGCDSGIVIYDRPSGQTWTRYHNPRNLPILANAKIQNNITELYIDTKRRLWVFAWPSWAGGGQQFKFCLDSTGRFLDRDTIGLNYPKQGYSEYRHFYETKDGTLWVYGLNALISYDQASGSFYHNRAEEGFTSLSVDYKTVNQIIQDRDGSLWIATDKGLYFAAYGSTEQSTNNLIFSSSKEQVSITDILQMPNGDYWFACWGAGIKVIRSDFSVAKSEVFQQRPPASLPADAWNATHLLWSLCRQSSTGKIWMGSNGGYLTIFDPVTKKTEYSRPPIFNGSTIRFIAEDTTGNIWMGTQSGRVVKWKAGTFTLVQDLGTIVYKIFPDKAGWIWVATHEKGLYALHPETGNILQHYTANRQQNGLLYNSGTDIEQLDDSTIVFGAGAINLINKKRRTVRILDTEDGLPSNTVMRLRMDNNGHLWVITANGLCRYNPINNRITPYGRRDGIVLAEQTNATDFRAADGSLLFAGSNSLIMFNPNTYLNFQPPPDVTITDFRLFNQYLPADSLLGLPQVKLQTDQNSFSIYFSSISFVQRDKMTYYYKMEGVDKEWIQSDVSKLVSYSLLPPGRYTFKVYCETIEGIRTRGITQMSFTILPPFWRTKWFISSLLFLLALAVYGIHNMRVNRLLAVEKLRNRVARDLHDDMGSTLSTINILSSMAKTKMSTDAVKTTEYLSKISDNSQRMMEAMDDIVWSIKPSNDSMQRVTARMREFATNVLEAKDIELHFSVGEEVYEVKLNMEARRDFFLVFKEAVNNAAKYSKADKVTVCVELNKRTLVLTVQDNGRGFDVAKADNGNGLGNMQKRADAMNGKVRIVSQEGNGTKVMVLVPVKNQVNR
jgi:signal transduction histidine kinase/ligand-binding sensor domain-containing protein